MAGVAGLEPAPKVLETSMLTIDTIPLCPFWILDCRFWIEEWLGQSKIQNLKSKMGLFVFFVQRMAAATTTELFEFQSSRSILFVFSRDVVAFLAFRTL